jgi:hypothetical protein
MTKNWRPIPRSRTTRQPGVAAFAPNAVPTRLKRAIAGDRGTGWSLGDLIGSAQGPKPTLVTRQTRAGDWAGPIQRP